MYIYYKIKKSDGKESSYLGYDGEWVQVLRSDNTSWTWVNKNQIEKMEPKEIGLNGLFKVLGLPEGSFIGVFENQESFETGFVKCLRGKIVIKMEISEDVYKDIKTIIEIMEKHKGIRRATE